MCKQLFAIGCIIYLGLISSCKPYSKPGSRGTIPVPDSELVNGGHNAIFYEEKIIPDSLTCEDPYTLVIRNSDVFINCENYDYTLLYNKAVEKFNERTSSIKCKSEDCNIIRTTTIYQSGVCNGRIATVIIKFEIKCVKNETPDQNGLSFRIGDELKVPFKDSIPVPVPVKTETLLNQLWNDPQAQDCPYDFSFRIEDYFQIQSCDDINDYRPFILRVEMKARKIWEETICATQDGCEKLPLKEIGVKWDCQNNRIKIQYWMEVICAEK